jgi:hypothetical protein
VRRAPSGGLAAWLCSDGMPASMPSSRHVHHPTVMPLWTAVVIGADIGFSSITSLTRFPCARTSKSEWLNNIGCCSECRKPPMSVVTGNANRVTRLAGIAEDTASMTNYQ